MIDMTDYTDAARDYMMATPGATESNLLGLASVARLISLTARTLASKARTIDGNNTRPEYETIARRIHDALDDQFTAEVWAVVGEELDAIMRDHARAAA